LDGRIVFGAAAALLGVIALMLRDSDTWQTLRQIWRRCPAAIAPRTRPVRQYSFTY
jgi:hypothetical protein